ncbi:hypothetical protein VTJ04DRAFT_9689 [Mycothermus thermophilus]|uniref:uncharacterized protein n=1 Tax=Humicola insolens TaxID=85995 RepID=UPI0037436F06
MEILEKEWKSKFYLRLVSTMSMLIIGALATSLAVNRRVKYMEQYGFIVLVPAISLTFMWNVAEVSVIFSQRDRRGIHPLAITFIDLLIWIAWVFVLLLFGINGLASRPGEWIHNYSGLSKDVIDGFDASRVTPADKKLETEIKFKGGAMLALMAVIAIIHFWLSIMGCSEADTRKFRIKRVSSKQPVSTYQPLGDAESQRGAWESTEYVGAYESGAPRYS